MSSIPSSIPCPLDALPALLEYAVLEEEWAGVVGHAGVEAFIAKHKVPASGDCPSHDTGEWLKRKRRAALELARVEMSPQRHRDIMEAV